MRTLISLVFVQTMAANITELGDIHLDEFSFQRVLFIATTFKE